MFVEWGSQQFKSSLLGLFVTIERVLKSSMLLSACIGECKKALSSTNISERDGNIVCTTCHRKHNATIAPRRISSYIVADRRSLSISSATGAVDDGGDADDAASQSPITHAVKHCIRHFLFIVSFFLRKCFLLTRKIFVEKTDRLYRISRNTAVVCLAL